MYKYSSCPSCKGESFSPFLNCEDHTVSHEKFDIVSCSTCGLHFTNPIPDLALLGNYYKSEEYISHSDTKRGLVAKLYHIVRNRTLKQKLKLVASHVSRGTVLDYGCGTGAFLETCRVNGWKAFGMEPDEGARKLAFESGLNVSASKEIVEERTRDHKFNAITLWHVLEHVSDLQTTLKFFKEKLAREGMLFIAVPNYTSFDAQTYGAFWAAYDVPRHLYHFDANSIQKLLGQYGFTLVATHPMVFDSYYVSMLSEKYKHGRINYLRAFLTGLKSNFKAKSAQDYSSVIYVFKSA